MSERSFYEIEFLEKVCDCNIFTSPFDVLTASHDSAQPCSRSYLGLEREVLARNVKGQTEKEDLALL